MNVILSNLTLFIYFIATLKHILFLIHRRPLLFKIAMGAVALGFLSHTVTLILMTVQAHRLPFANFSESLAFSSWVVVLAYLLAEWRYRISALGSFVMPVAFFGIFLALILPGEGTPLIPVMANFWFLIHLVFAFLGTAAFTLTFGVGVMYILQEGQLKSRRPGVFYHRLPSLEMLDDLSHKALSWGFPFLTLGLVAGFIWIRSAKGSFWDWDPHKTWPLLIAWAIYGILLLGRLNGWWRGRKAARGAVFGFVLVSLSYWLHTYS